MEPDWSYFPPITSRLPCMDTLYLTCHSEYGDCWRLCFHSELRSPGTNLVYVSRLPSERITKASPCTANNKSPDERNGDCQCSLHPDSLSPETFRTYTRTPEIVSRFPGPLSCECSSSSTSRFALTNMVSPSKAILFPKLDCFDTPPTSRPTSRRYSLSISSSPTRRSYVDGATCTTQEGAV